MVAQAGQQYLAAVTPLNAALIGFQAALTKASTQACSCPAGQFNASAAIVLIPNANRDIEAVQVALQRIKTELPRFSSEIDNVVSDNQRGLQFFASAFQAAQRNDAAGFSNNIGDVALGQQSSVLDISRLRADLGLPPPAA